MVGATQRIDMGYNESKEIAISIYNIFLIGLITIPMKFFFELKYDASFLLVFGKYELHGFASSFASFWVSLVYPLSMQNIHLMTFFMYFYFFLPITCAVGFTWCVTVSLIATFVPKITKLDWGDAQSKFNSKYLSTKSHAVVNTFEAKDELNIGENQAWVIYPGRDVAKFSCFNPDLIRREISIMQEYIRKLDSALSNSMVRMKSDLDSSAKPKKVHRKKTKVGPSGSTYYSKSGKLVENNTRKHVKEASGEEKRCVERTSMKRSEAIHSRGYLPSSYIPKSVNK